MAYQVLIFSYTEGNLQVTSVIEENHKLATKKARRMLRKRGTTVKTHEVTQGITDVKNPTIPTETWIPKGSPASNLPAPKEIVTATEAAIAEQKEEHHALFPTHDPNHPYGENDPTGEPAAPIAEVIREEQLNDLELEETPADNRIRSIAAFGSAEAFADYLIDSFTQAELLDIAHQTHPQMSKYTTKTKIAQTIARQQELEAQGHA